jgi:hypothetical protein
MSYQLADFVSQITLAVKTDKWIPIPVRGAQLSAIAGLLATDTTRLSSDVHRPPVGLRPGSRLNTAFTNKVLEIVNRGKAGNLTPAQMGTAINNGISGFLPPSNSAAPVASFVTGTGLVGSVVTCTPGSWTGSPTYARQWLRGGTAIAGATATSYTTVAADAGLSVSCRITATNAAGSTNATSNGLAIT